MNSGEMRKRWFLFTLVLTTVSAGCKQVSVANRSGFILGTEDNIKRLDETTASSEIEKALKQVVMFATTLSSGQQKFCSGLLVEVQGNSDKKEFAVVSNFHCFAHKNDDGSVDNQFLPEACLATKVYFGFSYDRASYAEEIDCVPGTLRGDYDGDLSTFLLSRDPGNGAQGAVFWEGDKTPVGEEAFLIHHPDVKSNYTRVGTDGRELPAASVTDADCYSEGDFPKSEWKLDRSLPFSLKHTCDLIDGSSGSPIFHKATGRVLGINWGGIDIAYKKGNEKTNSATKASFVKGFLDRNIDSIKENARATIEANSKKKNRSSDTTLENLKEQSCGTLGASSPRNYWYSFFLISMPLLLLTVH